MKKVDPNVPVAAPDSEALKSLFESAQGDGLQGAQIDQLWSRLGPAVAPGPQGPSGAGAAGAPSAATAGGGLVVKTLAVLAVGGSLAVGAYTHPWRASEPALPIVMVMATAQPSRSPVATQPVDTAAAIDSVPQTVPVVTLPTTAPVASAPPRTVSTGHAQWVAAVVGRTPDRAPSRQFPEQDAPASGGAGSIGANAANAGASSSSLASGPGAAGGSAASPAMATNAGIAPLPNEGALLLRARQQLASDPAGALALTDEHARRFPNGSGALVPEREVLAIEALAALGRLPEARARLAAFRAHYPQSAHLTRLDTLVGR